MKGKWRQNLHIEPPEGWMNDPNGLCFFDGLYHVYFQYRTPLGPLCEYGPSLMEIQGHRS